VQLPKPVFQQLDGLPQGTKLPRPDYCDGRAQFNRCGTNATDIVRPGLAVAFYSIVLGDSSYRECRDFPRLHSSAYALARRNISSINDVIFPLHFRE
jgi:hypothetical protein